VCRDENARQVWQTSPSAGRRGGHTVPPMTTTRQTISDKFSFAALGLVLVAANGFFLEQVLNYVK
jgi:hypothetical protein